MTTPQLTYTLTTNPAELATGSTGDLIVHGVVAGDGTADIEKIVVTVPLTTDGTESRSLGYANSIPTIAPPDGWSGSWNAGTATFTADAAPATVGQTILDFRINGINLNPNPASCTLTVTETAEVNYTNTSAQVKLPVVVSDGTYVPPAITTSVGEISPGTAGQINWSGSANYGYVLEPVDMYVMPTGGALDNNENINTVPLLSSKDYTLSVTDSTSDPTKTYPYQVTVDVAKPTVLSLTVNGSDTSAVVDIDGKVTLAWTTQNADRVTIYMNEVPTHTVLAANGNYDVEIDRPQQFRISARYEYGPDCDPAQDDNESLLFPADALTVTPTDPQITTFVVANDKLFADSTVYLTWAASNANKIRLQNTLNTVIDYTPNVSNYNAGKPTLGVVATGDDSPLNYNLWAWYEPSGTRVLVWGDTQATYPDVDASAAELITDAVATDDAEVPEPNDQKALELSYVGSTIRYKTFSYSPSSSAKSLTLDWEANSWDFGVTGFDMQLSGSSSRDLHRFKVDGYTYDGVKSGGQTTANFSAGFCLEDNNGHKNNSDDTVDFVVFYTGDDYMNALVSSHWYDGDYSMTSTSDAKTFTADNVINYGGNPAREPSSVIPFINSINTYYDDGDEELTRLLLNAQSSAAPVSAGSINMQLSGYSIAFGDHTFKTSNPGTGFIGLYEDAGGGYGVALKSNTDASHTFDFEVDEAVAVLNKFDASSGDGDHNIYKVRSDKVTCAVDATNACKVNLTWGSAYWGDKSNTFDASRKVLVFAKYKVPTAS